MPEGYRIAIRKHATSLPRSVRLVWSVFALTAAAGWLAHAAGLRVNTTPSMPLGLWRIEIPHRALRPGDIVMACPPDAPAFREAAARGYLPQGSCSGRFEPLLKPVAAVAGDVVTLSAEGVAVNGSPIPGTAPLVMDTVGRPLRPLASGHYPVAERQIWLVSAHTPLSWDSRYFGALPAANILGVARPVWVWP